MRCVYFVFHTVVIVLPIVIIIAIGIVAAGRIHSGFVKPGMSITFGPTDLNTKVTV